LRWATRLSTSETGAVLAARARLAVPGLRPKKPEAQVKPHGHDAASALASLLVINCERGYEIIPSDPVSTRNRALVSFGKSGFFCLRSAALRPVSQKTGSREQLRASPRRKEGFSFLAKALTKAVAFLVQSCDVLFRVVLQKFRHEYS
jgi:hypothetical protein